VKLPDGWACSPLRDFVGREGVFADGDWIESKDQDPLGEVRLVQLADVGDGKWLNKSNRHLTSAKAAQLRCTVLSEGDLLVARMPDPLGRACIFPGDAKPCVTVVDVCIVRTGTDVSHDWLMYSINSPEFRGAIKLNASGTTRQRISRKNLGDLELPLPPLNEQRRIVDKIEALTARSRRAKEALDAVPVLLDKLRQSILAAAFRGDLTKEWRAAHPDVEPASVLLDRIRKERRARWEEAELAKLRAKGSLPKDDKWKSKYVEPEPVNTDDLPELPEGWAWANVDALTADTFYGPRFGADDYTEVGVPTLRTTDMDEHGNIVPKDPPMVSVGDAEIAALGLKHGDVLITRTGSIGKCAVYEGKPEVALPSAYLIRFRLAGNQDLSRFLVAFLHSPRGQECLGVASTAVTQPNVNAPAIRSFALPIPPADEMHALVALLDACLPRMTCFGRSHTGLAQELTRLNSAILAKAFRGELVPQDPNDEPASALLERIRAERESSATTTSSRKPRAKRSGAETAAPARRKRATPA
jgi:type I restriction enzyme S subunit